MASRIASVNPTCPVCFESFPVVKMLSTCKHVFCRRCLSIHIAKSSPESVVIPCPTCRFESPLPKSGVDGLVDYTRDGTDVDGLELLGAVGGGEYFDAKPAESDIMEGNNEHCLVCKFKSNSPTVQAEYLCEDCGQFPLCRDCTKLHCQNKATRDHVVTSWKHKKSRKKAMCKSHDQMMTSYCSTCGKLVCRVCVMLEHGDHVNKKIGEIIRELLTDLSAATKEKEKQLNDLRQMEKDLQEMKLMALGERDTLVKTIEDHAEKCIEEILMQKKALKAKVNADYKVIEDMSTCLERIPNIRQKLEDSVRQAESMVSRRVHPNDLEKIANTKESLVMSGKLADQINGEAYIEDYQRVQQKGPMFEPNTIEFTIGHLTGGAITAETVNKTDSAGGFQAAGNAKPRLRDIRQCYFIFKTSYVSYISSVANLGKKFAVSQGNPYRNQRKIDIYEFAGPANLKYKIQNIKDLGHIASTPDGNLAVLCLPNHGNFFVIIFDSERRRVMSTTYLDYIAGLGGLFSFGVTARNDYVVCSAYQPLKVTVFRQDGSVVFSQEVEKEYIRTACSGEFVFACDSRYCIDAFALRENQLVFIGSCELLGSVLDVSATPDGEVTVLCRRNGFICFGRSVLGKDGFSEWVFKDLDEQCRLRGNISVCGRHIVASFDDNIRVFAEEGEAT